MPWIPPIGVEDPDNEWESKENILEWESPSYAVRSDLPSDTWSGFLVFTYPRVVADQFWFRRGTIGQEILCDLDVYDGDAWQDIAEALISYAAWHFYHDLSDVWITKVRFRIKHYEAEPTDVSVAGTAIFEICRGPLADICGFLRGVGEFFVDLAADIREVWVVGEYLATPFEWLGELFDTGANNCCAASVALQDILDALEGGITPAAILLLIQDNWPTLYDLITDPIDWFLVQLTLAFDLEPWHTQSLEFFAKWILEEYFPTLYQIWFDPASWIEDNVIPLIPELPAWLTDPVGWLEATLQEHFPILYYLVVDPTGEILYLIGLVFDLTPWEAQSPEFIVKALFERYFPELYLLWRDPEATLWTWLLDKFEDVFDGIHERLYYLAEHTLRFFWEGEW